MPNPKSNYAKLGPCCNCRLPNKEYYSPPVTLSLPEWQNYVASGQNTFPGDAIVPGGTMDDGAVYQGHVRQNPYTAFLPHPDDEPHENPAPYWYY